MPSTYTSSLGLVQQATGENLNTWGSILNAGMIALIDTAVAGIQAITTTGGTTTLTSTQGAANTSRAAILSISGTLVSNATIVVPNVSKTYIVANNTSGAFNVIMSAGGTTINITQGQATLCYTDGTNFYAVGNASTSLQGTATGNIDMNNFLFDRPLINRYKEQFNNNGSISTSLALNYFNGNAQAVTLTGNVTATLSNWPSSGEMGSMTLFCIQDATGGRTLTFSGSTVKVPGGGGLVLSTAPNAVDQVVFDSYDGGNTLYLSALKSYG